MPVCLIDPAGICGDAKKRLVEGTIAAKRALLLFWQ